MDKMRKMMIIWGMMIIAIVGVLVFIGFSYSTKVKDYHNFEDELVNATEKYVEKYFLYDDKLEVKMETLINEGLINSNKVNDNECKGYIIVSKNGLVYEYDAYINCDVYKTKGYDK